MNQSDILKKKRQKYFDLLDKIQDTCYGLDRGISQLDEVTNKVANGYMIDDAGADHGYLQDTANTARKIHNQLSYTVIPEINKKISRLTDQISDALLAEQVEGSSK